MAEAFKTNRAKEVVTTVTVQENIITLELSSLEAAALMCITQKVGGRPSTTPRGKIDDIRKALIEVGVAPQPHNMCDPKYNAIQFNKDTLHELSI